MFFEQSDFSALIADPEIIGLHISPKGGRSAACRWQPVWMGNETVCTIFNLRAWSNKSRINCISKLAAQMVLISFRLSALSECILPIRRNPDISYGFTCDSFKTSWRLRRLPVRS